MRILVADDQAGIRRRVCLTLEARLAVDACDEAANGQEAVDRAREINPDLVILDITMPVMNGLEAARIIRRLQPKIPILILSMHKSRQLMEEAQKIGVQGYVVKSEAGENLIPAVTAVLQSQTFYPTEF